MRRWESGMGSARRCAVVLAVVGLVLALPSVAAAAATDGCELITARELERVLKVRFTPNPVGPSGCLWLSEEADTLGEVNVSANDSFSKDVIATGKRSERKEPGAVVLKGIGDLTIVRPQPQTDPSGNTTLGLLVFEGTTVGQIAVTIDGVTPTTKQMRSLGKILAKRL